MPRQPASSVGVGRGYAGTRILVLVENLDIRIVNAVTGELLRELQLNPHIDYQPQYKSRKQ